MATMAIVPMAIMPMATMPRVDATWEHSSTIAKMAWTIVCPCSVVIHVDEVKGLEMEIALVFVNQSVN